MVTTPDSTYVWQVFGTVDDGNEGANYWTVDRHVCEYGGRMVDRPCRHGARRVCMVKSRLIAVQRRGGCAPVKPPDSRVAEGTCAAIAMLRSGGYCSDDVQATR
jgi:hypothetical protein